MKEGLRTGETWLEDQDSLREVTVSNTSNKKCLLYQIQVTNWQCWWVMKKPEREVLITLGPCNDAVSNTSNGFMMVVNEKSKICYWSNVTVTAFTNKQTNTTNTSRYKVDFNVFPWLALCIFFFQDTYHYAIGCKWVFPHWWCYLKQETTWIWILQACLNYHTYCWSQLHLVNFCQCTF